MNTDSSSPGSSSPDTSGSDSFEALPAHSALRLFEIAAIDADPELFKEYVSVVDPERLVYGTQQVILDVISSVEDRSDIDAIKARVVQFALTTATSMGRSFDNQPHAVNGALHYLDRLLLTTDVEYNEERGTVTFDVPVHVIDDRQMQAQVNVCLLGGLLIAFVVDDETDAAAAIASLRTDYWNREANRTETK